MAKAKKNRPSAFKRAVRGTTRLTAAAGVGAAIGAAAALWFAPSSGKKLQKDVKRAGKKTAAMLAKEKTAIEHELHAVIETLPPTARRSLNLAKSKLAKAIVSGKEALTSDRYRRMVETVMKQFGDESEHVSESVQQAKKQWIKAFSRIKKHLK